MNFHGLFGAMMGERGGGYGYMNPYEQFPPSVINHNHQNLLNSHSQQNQAEQQLQLQQHQQQQQQQQQQHQLTKPDHYGSLAHHMRTPDFFNHNLYQSAPAAPNRPEHLGYEHVYRYSNDKQPGLDMRLQERIEPTHEQYERVQEHLSPHASGSAVSAAEEHNIRHKLEDSQQNPYGQFPLFFPHFLQNFRPTESAETPSPPTKSVIEPPTHHDQDIKPSLARKTPKTPKSRKMDISKEIKVLHSETEGHLLDDGENQDTEEVPDHEKVFTENIEEMCQCLCKICNTSMKFRSLREHVRFQHSMNIQMYKEKYGNIYTRLTYHRCRLCEKVVKASYDFLNNHVSKVHKMSFAQYRSKFDIFKGRSKKIFKGENSEATDKVFTDKLDEMCLCRCEICQSELEPYNMRHHVKSKHNMALDVYRDQFGEIEFSRETFHRCKLCQKEILFEYQKLSSHLYSGHSLGISKYINLFLSPSENSTENENKEILNEHECKVCNSTFAANKFRYHLQSEHSLNTRRYEEMFGHINDFQYKSSDDTADMCTFKCKICESVLQAQEFSGHIVNKHNMNLKAYRAEHGKLTFENKTFHRCKECDRDILFTITAVKRHLETKHSMTFKKYRTKHCIFTSLRDTGLSSLKGSGRVRRKKHLTSGLESLLLGMKDEPPEAGQEAPPTPSGSRFSDQVAEMVKFACQLCKEVLNRTELKKHVPKEHGVTYYKYLIEHGDPVPTQTILHRCKICSLPVIFDKELLTQHLKPNHSISFAQYKNFFGAFSDVIKKNSTPPARRSRRNNPGPGLDCDQDTEEMAESTIPVCMYACKECDAVLNRRQLIKHIVRVHRMRYKEYRDAHGVDTPVQKLYHSCKICSTRLLACYDTIKSHTRDKHNITFREYRGVCEEIQSTEFKSSDILDNPVLAQALNIKIEANESGKTGAGNLPIKSERDSESDGEFDHEDVTFAMSVEYKEGMGAETRSRRIRREEDEEDEEKEEEGSKEEMEKMKNEEEESDDEHEAMEDE